MVSIQDASPAPAAPINVGLGPGVRDKAHELILRMERIPFSPWHMRARIVMGSATFLDAFDALSLAFALPVLIGLWHMSPVEVGWMIAASYIGQLVGALLFSRLSESYGRVPCAALATGLMSVMSLVCAFAGNFQMLFIFRLVQGIGVGGEMPVAATYISEMSRAQGRGRFFMLYEMIFPVGLMACGQIGTLLVPIFGWKVLFALGGIPGLIVTYLLLRLPESPRWLIGRGRLAEAERNIERAEASARAKFGADCLVETQAASPASRAPMPSVLVPKGRWREVLSGFYRRRTLIAWTLWASAFFIANSLNNWMPTLYRTVYGLTLPDALRAASMTNVAQVIVLLLCAFFIDRVGRRAWTVACFAAGGALSLTLALGAIHQFSFVVVMATLIYGLIGSINAVLYLYTPEIYPTRIRAIGTGLSTSWLRIGSAVGPAIVGYLVAGYGVSSVFVMFAAVAVIGVVAALGMVNTENRQLEEIAP
jgi:putative MFS transporter